MARKASLLEHELNHEMVVQGLSGLVSKEERRLSAEPLDSATQMTESEIRSLTQAAEQRREYYIQRLKGTVNYFAEIDTAVRQIRGLASRLGGVEMLGREHLYKPDDNMGNKLVNSPTVPFKDEAATTAYFFGDSLTLLPCKIKVSVTQLYNEEEVLERLLSQERERKFSPADYMRVLTNVLTETAGFIGEFGNTALRDHFQSMAVQVKGLYMKRALWEGQTTNYRPADAAARSRGHW